MDMYTYEIAYREKGGWRGSSILSTISLPQKFAVGQPDLNLIRDEIRQRYNDDAHTILNIVLQEWKSVDAPPHDDHWMRDYIIDLGPDHEHRILRAVFNGIVWQTTMSGEQVAPYRWLLKTPIIPFTESGGIVL